MGSTHNMSYNSTKDELIMSEYGRNIQEMIRYVREMEDPQQRQAYIEKIVNLMMQITPQNRSMDDSRDKLWKHVFKIAGYDIDVMPPNGQIPKPEEERKKPAPLGYPVLETKFRHYGHNVQQLIRKAIAMEPGPLREGFVEVIGSYMKLAFKTWNREHYVSDDIIIEDMKALSNGMLEVHENAELDNLSQSNRKKPGAPYPQQQPRQPDGKRDNRKFNGGQGRRKFRRKQK
jgi:hypothetical protein